MNNKEASFFAAYVIIGFLVFGWLVNTLPTCPDWIPIPTVEKTEGMTFEEWRVLHDKAWDEYRGVMRARSECSNLPPFFVPVVAGMAWPVYFAGKFSIWITRP